MGCKYSIDPNFFKNQIPHTIYTDSSENGINSMNGINKQETSFEEDFSDNNDNPDIKIFSSKMEQIMYELTWLKKRASKYKDKESIKKLNW